MTGQAKPAGASLDSEATVRVPVEARFTFVVEDFAGFILETSGNVSTGGMFIRTRSPRPVGTKIEFEFRLADDDPLMRGRAVVVWVRGEDEGPDRPAGMGIRYTWLDGKSRELVEHIVENHARVGGMPYLHEVPATAATPPASASAPLRGSVPHPAASPPPTYGKGRTSSAPPPGPARPPQPDSASRIPTPRPGTRGRVHEPTSTPPAQPVASTGEAPAVSPRSSHPATPAVPAPPAEPERTDWNRELESGDLEINFDIVADDPPPAPQSELEAAEAPPPAERPAAVVPEASRSAHPPSTAPPAESGPATHGTTEAEAAPPPEPARVNWHEELESGDLEINFDIVTDDPMPEPQPELRGVEAPPPPEKPAAVAPKVSRSVHPAPSESPLRPRVPPTDDLVTFSAPPSLPMPAPPPATVEAGGSGSRAASPAVGVPTGPPSSAHRQAGRVAKRAHPWLLRGSVAAVLLLLAVGIFFGTRYLPPEIRTAIAELAAPAPSSAPAPDLTVTATRDRASSSGGAKPGVAAVGDLAPGAGSRAAPRRSAPAPRQPESTGSSAATASQSTPPPAPRRRPPGASADAGRPPRPPVVGNTATVVGSTPPSGASRSQPIAPVAEPDGEVAPAASSPAPPESRPEAAAARPVERDPLSASTPRPAEPGSGLPAGPRTRDAAGPSPSDPPARPAAPAPDRALPAAPPTTAPPPLPARARRGQLVALGTGVTPPVVRRRVDPRYPERAVKARREAVVELTLLIDENGDVVDVRLGDSKKDVFGFDQAAAAAARRTKFRPATKDGVEVRVWFPYRIAFRLQ